MKLFKASGLPSVIGGMGTEELLESWFSARAGLCLIRAAALLRASSTIVAVAVVCLLFAIPALAQGSILNNDASRPVSLAKRAVDIFSWLMIIVGVFGIGRGIWRGIQGAQGWGASAGWGTAALGFGYVISWINAEVNGNQVALPEP
ncbi:MAG TPA: hypothetical protein VE715_01190 [Blastocatellia bacterium]|nr:hypothetical protein [Blastocatellia bacterium]